MTCLQPSTTSSLRSSIRLPSLECVGASVNLRFLRQSTLNSHGFSSEQRPRVSFSTTQFVWVSSHPTEERSSYIHSCADSSKPSSTNLAAELLSPLLRRSPSS